MVYAMLGDYDYSQVSKETNVTFKNLGKPRWGLLTNTGVYSNFIYKGISLFLGKYLLFPDIALLPMVKRSIKQEGAIDLLITIAVPHVIHYAVSKSDLSKVRSWIADCGDPFMGNPFLKRPAYFENFERSWCEKCNFITIPIKEAETAYYPEYIYKIRVIPQGFDFSSIRLAQYNKNSKPTFAYSGTFYKGLRDPSAFLKYISDLDRDFKFVVYTNTKELFQPFLERLSKKIELRDYVPREQLLFELSNMDFLINISNKSGVQQPSKLIDYALTKRPILDISSDFTDTEKHNFLAFLMQDYSNQHFIKDIDSYNIVNVAKYFILLTRL